MKKDIQSIKIYCDGGARGNPGPASSAFIVFKDRENYYQDSKYLGETTNNVAEYQAVIMALNWLSIKSKLKSEKILRIVIACCMNIDVFKSGY